MAELEKEEEKQKRKKARKQRKKERRELEQKRPRIQNEGVHDPASQMDTTTSREISRASTASASLGVDAHRSLLAQFLKNRSYPRSDDAAFTQPDDSSSNSDSVHRQQTRTNESQDTQQKQSRKRKRDGTDESKSARESTLESEAAQSVPASASPDEREEAHAAVSTGPDERVSTVQFPTSGPFVPPEMKMVYNAVDAFRVRHDLSQVDVNNLIQGKPSKRDPVKCELWATIFDAAPHRDQAALRRFARRKYHNYDNRAVWDAEDDKALREAYELNPQSWVTIGRQLGRMPEDCRDRYRNYLRSGDGWVRRDWTEQEEVRLSIAVQECIEAVRSEAKQRARDENTPFEEQDWERLINFTNVSERFGPTRNRIQCYTHWRRMRKRERHDPPSKTRIPHTEVNWKHARAAQKFGKLDTLEKLGFLIQIQKTNALDERRIPWKQVKARDLSWTSFEKTQAFEKMKELVEPRDTHRDTVAELIDYFKIERRKEMNNTSLEASNQAIEAELTAYSNTDPPPNERMEVDHSSSEDDDDEQGSDISAALHSNSQPDDDDDEFGKPMTANGPDSDSSDDSSGAESHSDRMEEGLVRSNEKDSTNSTRDHVDHVQKKNSVSDSDSGSGSDSDSDSNNDSDSDSDSDGDNKNLPDETENTLSNKTAEEVTKAEAGGPSTASKHAPSEHGSLSGSESENSSDESSNSSPRNSPSPEAAPARKLNGNTGDGDGAANENESGPIANLSTRDVSNASATQTTNIVAPIHNTSDSDSDSVSDSDSDSSASSEARPEHNIDATASNIGVGNNLVEKTRESSISDDSSDDSFDDSSDVQENGQMNDQAATVKRDDLTAQASRQDDVNIETKNSSHDSSSDESTSNDGDNESDNESDVDDDAPAAANQVALQTSGTQGKDASQAGGNIGHEQARNDKDSSDDSPSNGEEVPGLPGIINQPSNSIQNFVSGVGDLEQNGTGNLPPKVRSRSPSTGLANSSSSSDAPLPLPPAANNPPSKLITSGNISDSSSESSDDDDDDDDTSIDRMFRR